MSDQNRKDLKTGTTGNREVDEKLVEKAKEQHDRVQGANIDNNFSDRAAEKAGETRGDKPAGSGGYGA